MSEPGSSVTGQRAKIVAAAREFAAKYHNSAYLLGGKSTAAFDCSYFVYLVFHSVFKDYKYADSAAIVSSPSLFKKNATGTPGDIVFFPAQQVPYAAAKGDKKTYPNHVGIVLDSSTWVGRQTSSLGAVLYVNPWWGSRERAFYAYAYLDPAAAPATAAQMGKSAK